MTTSNTTLAQALDRHLDQMNERAATWLQIIQRDAANLSADLRYTADAVTVQNAVDHRPDMNKLASMIAMQGHLDELLQQYSALLRLRESIQS